MSYLEAWFYDKVIVRNELESKYDIVNEYCEYPYFLDFAFVNERIDVELDGKYHQIEDRRKHDEKRAAYLKEKRMEDI